MGIFSKFIKQVGHNLKQVGLLLVEFQKILPNKRVGCKICYLLEWKKCKNDNRVYSFIWHPRVLSSNFFDRYQNFLAEVKFFWMRSNIYGHGQIILAGFKTF